MVVCLILKDSLQIINLKFSEKEDIVREPELESLNKYDTKR